MHGNVNEVDKNGDNDSSDDYISIIKQLIIFLILTMYFEIK